MEKVWVVTYTDLSGAPIVTVWDNRESAAKHYDFLKKRRSGCITLDEAPIHHIFEVVNDGKETD